MLKLKLKKFVILSLGMTSFIGAAAFADSEEGLARRGERYVQEMANYPIETPRAKTANLPLVVYRHGSGSIKGVAAEITEVARYKHYLFLYNAYDHGPQVVAYVTTKGAEADLQRIKNGESVDATRCMIHDQWLSSESIGPYTSDCRKHTYTLKMDCDELTMVPLMTNIHREWYGLQDIVGSPLQTTEERCLKENPAKY